MIAKKYLELISKPEGLLLEWLKSTKVMHQGHHIAATRYNNHHRTIGTVSAILSAIIATSLFISLSTSDNRLAIIISGIISMLASALTGVSTFLGLNEKANRHLQAATLFQAVRREIEEEIMNINQGKIKENYLPIREKWTKALDTSIPLPKGLYDSLSNQVGDD
ncbi:MAG: SLATT domain-containing protein [Bacteroidota bacterium]